MKFYSQAKTPHLFDLHDTLDHLSKTNRWVILADRLPWGKFELEYNTRLNNGKAGAGNKAARIAVGALMIKHIEKLSDIKTIQAIQENPYMQYFVGLEVFTDKPIFDASLFVTIRKRLDEEFFNMLTCELMKIQKQLKEIPESNDKPNGNAPANQPEVSESPSEKEQTHAGILKMDATCCDAEMRFPTDHNLLEDGSEFIYRMLVKSCEFRNISVPSNHRSESRKAFLILIKKKHKGKKLRDYVRRTQLNCLQADIQILMNGMMSDFCSQLSKTELRTLLATFEMYRQQSMMFREHTNRCDNRIVSIYQPHVRPIVRGKAKAKVEFGAKIGAAITQGYTFIDHLSWDAYNESSDLLLHINAYRERFGYYPSEVQIDKIYLTKENRKLLKTLDIACHCPALGRPPKVVDLETARLRHKANAERNEIEATFGTAKRVYAANNIRAKLPSTAASWIGACFLAKNLIKFLRELFAYIFEILLLLKESLGFSRVQTIQLAILA